MKIKDYLFIAVVILLIYFIGITFNKPNYVFDDKTYKRKEDSLKSKLDSLDKVLQSEIKSKTDLQNKIHYLDSLKQKIKYVYVIKEKEIDTASVPNLINKFKDVFAEGNSN